MIILSVFFTSSMLFLDFSIPRGQISHAIFLENETKRKRRKRKLRKMRNEPTPRWKRISLCACFNISFSFLAWTFFACSSFVFAITGMEWVGQKRDNYFAQNKLFLVHILACFEGYLCRWKIRKYEKLRNGIAISWLHSDWASSTRITVTLVLRHDLLVISLNDSLNGHETETFSTVSFSLIQSDNWRPRAHSFGQ